MHENASTPSDKEGFEPEDGGHAVTWNREGFNPAMPKIKMAKKGAV